ncbi:MAG: sulfite exporter TauE/SafE family protein [Lachnospiraceae bacterium]|nr:sulfite exporter TauE/SafE family protein [Lachnospiraceae bacterium]
MIWWIIAAIAAFFVKGLCGFANTLVFTTILSFGNNNVNISPVELLLGYPTNLILAWKERKSIQWSVCLPLAVLVLLGSIPGIWFLKSTNTSVIKVVFGFAIVLIGAEMLLREWKKKKAKESKVVLGFIGILSGVLCGLYGVGALLGAYISRVTEDTKAFKANICVVFLIENTFRVILYAVLGIITLDILKQAVILVPCMLVGLFLGIQSGKVLDDKLVKKLVIVMLMISGMALVWNNL